MTDSWAGQRRYTMSLIIYNENSKVLKNNDKGTLKGIGDSMKKGGLTGDIWDNSAPNYLSTVMNC